LQRNKATGIAAEEKSGTIIFSLILMGIKNLLPIFKKDLMPALQLKYGKHLNGETIFQIFKACVLS
jgi:hypothetical protein